MHFPGLSHSGSGTQVVLRGADSVGPAFVPFPGPSSSGGEVMARAIAATYHLPAARLSRCTTGAPSQAAVDRPDPQEVLV